MARDQDGVGVAVYIGGLLLLLLLLSRSDPNMQHSKVLYRWGVQEKRKERKTQRRSEEKVVGFRSDSLFLSRKREAVTQGVTKGIDHPMRRRSKTAGAFHIHSRKTKITRARTP